MPTKQEASNQYENIQTFIKMAANLIKKLEKGEIKFPKIQ